MKVTPLTLAAALAQTHFVQSWRNNPPPDSVEHLMRIGSSLIGITVMLGGVLGCQGGEEARSVEPAPTTVVVTTGPPDTQTLTPEERVVQWITSCEVREILFSHENVAYVRFRDGGRGHIRLGDDATADRFFAAALEQPCPGFKRNRIIVAIE